MNASIAARTERIADLIRLSIGMKSPDSGTVSWRCRHLPLHRLRADADQVHRLVTNVCSDMWGDAADKDMVQAAYCALDARMLQVEPVDSERARLRA
ncbi:MAG TPA: hypothetical protein VFL14_16385 [Xanthomonadales bacterium]|nr:hypothetical protein [Xanthomonadales bacterium]